MKKVCGRFNSRYDARSIKFKTNLGLNSKRYHLKLLCYRVAGTMKNYVRLTFVGGVSTHRNFVLCVHPDKSTIKIDWNATWKFVTRNWIGFHKPTFENEPRILRSISPCVHLSIIRNLTWFRLENWQDFED